MIVAGSVEESRANRNHRVLPNGAGFWRSELVTIEGGAQSFLVEQDPDTIVLPHFHFEDEFQIVIGGSGMLGSHALRPGFVHYAAKHTGYGPLEAGAAGLAYLTFRAVLDLGAHFLPEERERMRPGRRRNLFGNTFDLINVSDQPIVEARTDSVLACQDDGVAAWSINVPPGKVLQLPDRSGNDRFLLVVSGALAWDARHACKLSTIFVSRDERDFRPTGGPAGATLLALQFGRGK
jgi:hypothetical protein